MSNFKCQISNVRGAGFTLIELLVVFSILVIGSVVGIASFGEFQKDKILDTTIAEIESFLNNARANAVTQTFPHSITCNSIQKYSVAITSSDTYEMDVYCNNESNPRLLKIRRLPSEVKFVYSGGENIEIFFNIANGFSQEEKIIRFVESSKQIKIDTAGNITIQ